MKTSCLLILLLGGACSSQSVPKLIPGSGNSSSQSGNTSIDPPIINGGTSIDVPTTGFTDPNAEEANVGIASSQEIPVDQEEILQSFETLDLLADFGTEVIKTGSSYLGVPYQFGAEYEATQKFDCSSFAQFVYKKNGVSSPRGARSQFAGGTPVSRSNLQVGDLVFFSTQATLKYPATSINRIGHVGLYAGQGRVLHTYGEGGVRFSTMTSGWWNDHYLNAARYAPGTPEVIAGLNDLRAIYRFYHNSTNDRYQTRWADKPHYGPKQDQYTADGLSFHIYVADNGAERHAIYSCWNAEAEDQFISVDSKCEGKTKIGIMGYVNTKPVGRPLLRCYHSGVNDHVASAEAGECGRMQFNEELVLGYVP